MTIEKPKKASPSPRPFIIAGYSLIFVTFGVMGGWAATARLDSAVVAHGTIDVASNRKEVQHLEGGIIKNIAVVDGDVVHAGDVLVRLDEVQARGNLQVLSIRLRIAQAMEARLQAERRMSKTLDLPDTLKNDETPEVKSAVSDQIEIFNDRVSILTSQRSILENRIGQLEREKEGLAQQSVSFERRVSILKEQLDRLREGLKSGAIQSNVISTREEEFVEVEQNIARMDTEIAKTDKSIGETRFQISQTEQQYKERASSEYKEVNGQMQELVEHMKIAENVMSRLEIRAPVDGTVQSLRFHTTGGVIRPGEVVLEIVPNDKEMVINAQVSPIDIDSVHPGLKAEIKFSAFASRFVPIIIGEVANVSKGSINPEDGRTPPYFLARINVSKGMVPDNIESRLSAGMPADVIISTGERTVADYLTSPLTDAIRKSMREE
jgi:HlyD family type I secretion membrane fusion protein